MIVEIDGARLRAYRESLKLSRDKLSEKADVSVRHLSNLENGSAHNITIKKLLPICMVLGILVYDVLIIHFDDDEF